MAKLNGLFSLRTPEDLLDKLEVDFTRLCSAFPSSVEAQYAAFDFSVCAEHIPDWVSLTAGGSKTSHRSYPDGPIFSHIASGAKYFRVDDPRHLSAKDTKAVQGAFSPGAFQEDAFKFLAWLLNWSRGKQKMSSL